MAVNFTLSDDATYGFRLGAYDPALPLVIDPAVLVYGGYIGGSDYDAGYGIAVDLAGYVYIAGTTRSDETTFPETVGPDLTYNGDADAFVVKVKADGTGLVYAGYIGGSRIEKVGGIAVDSAGSAYVVGTTESSETTFPVIVGPDLIHNAGAFPDDAFIAKVKADGTGLVYCGYIGGSSDDLGDGVAVDATRNAYVTGNTYSNHGSFPVTVGPDLTFNGSTDAFVAKVKADGTGFVYVGYIGGSGFESGTGIAVDTAGNAYVTGYTPSTEATFPVTVGPDLTFNGGSDEGDVFVAKVKADGTGLVYAGYIGGSADDRGNGIAVDAAGNAYATGWAESTEADFPVTVGPDLSYNGGYYDTFVAKVNASGTGLAYCGYLGGDGGDSSNGMAIDAAGNAYVTGYTSSTEATFPVTAGPGLTYNGNWDTFVAKVKADGSGLVYAGYIGGSGYDYGNGIAVDATGNAYIAGQTQSDEVTFPEIVGPDLTHNGNWDAFVAKISSLEAAGFKVYLPLISK